MSMFSACAQRAHFSLSSACLVRPVGARAQRVSHLWAVWNTLYTSTDVSSLFSIAISSSNEYKIATYDPLDSDVTKSTKSGYLYPAPLTNVGG